MLHGCSCQDVITIFLFKNWLVYTIAAQNFVWNSLQRTFQGKHGYYALLESNCITNFQFFFHLVDFMHKSWLRRVTNNNA